eukprot:13520234-Alexandrium_andersonii.AAC.1
MRTVGEGQQTTPGPIGAVHAGTQRLRSGETAFLNTRHSVAQPRARYARARHQTRESTAGYCRPKPLLRTAPSCPSAHHPCLLPRTRPPARGEPAVKRT